MVVTHVDLDKFKKAAADLKAKNDKAKQKC
jgi:hypothetical protein